MKNWKDVYELPLRATSYTWVYDANDNFVFQFLATNEELHKRVIEILNGDRDIQGITDKFIYRDGFIQTESGKKLLLIRGWGNLTGVGAMNLPHEEAKNIQDTFAAYILSRFEVKP